MKTYIVWFDEAYEPAEDAAAAINGQIIPLMPDQSIEQAVKDAFPEISKLSPQGNTHARTLYAVVNVITRAAPLDVFAALTASGLYTPVGDNYWHMSDKG